MTSIRYAEKILEEVRHIFIKQVESHVSAVIRFNLFDILLSFFRPSLGSLLRKKVQKSYILHMVFISIMTVL